MKLKKGHVRHAMRKFDFGICENKGKGRHLKSIMGCIVIVFCDDFVRFCTINVVSLDVALCYLEHDVEICTSAAICLQFPEKFGVNH